MSSNYRPNPSNNKYIINATVEWPNAINIDWKITDNDRGKLDVVITGIGRPNSHRVVRFRGRQSNTFTGNVFIEGRGTALFLSKWNEVNSAVRSDIYVINGGGLGIEHSHQINDNAKVALQGRDSIFSLNASTGELYEKIKTLSVEDHGIVLFSRFSYERSRKTLVLDDLDIHAGGSLRVFGWNPDLDLFLIHKSSANVRAGLKRIKFEGPNRQIIELREYNKNYWKLYASPEPSTYGAIFGGMGVSLGLWRRRRSPPHRVSRG